MSVVNNAVNSLAGTVDEHGEPRAMLLMFDDREPMMIAQCTCVTCMAWYLKELRYAAAMVEARMDATLGAVPAAGTA